MALLVRSVPERGNLRRISLLFLWLTTVCSEMIALGV
jgi:hypothetical protein